MRAHILMILALTSSAHAAKWTVLSYFAADNNLEKPMVENVVEMTKVGTTADVNLVLQIDRGYQNADAMMATFPGAAYFSGVKRFVIQKDNAMEVGSLGDIDMRQASTLTDFIKWGVANYPADHYVLILSDHGGAWTGCCNDESLGSGVMDLASIAAGVSGGGVMLDVIGFDECLMGNLEVAWALAPLAKVLVASEEVEPGAGWDWTFWLQKLAADPTMDGVAIGKNIADGFLANIQNKEPPSADMVTLSVTDLSQVAALGTATSKLADALLPSAVDQQKWRPLAKARSAAGAFGVHGQGDEGLTIDLRQFAAATGDAAAGDLMAALDAAVKYKVAGAKFAQAGGLSIYLPLKNVIGAYGTIDFPRSTSWGKLVAAYAIQAAADSTPPQVSLTVTPMGNGRALVQATSADGDVAQVDTVLAAADGSFLGEMPGDGMFDGQWPALGDGTSDTFAPLFATGEMNGGSVIAVVPVDVDADGSGNFVPAELRLEIDLTQKTGTVAGAFDYSQGDAAEIDLSDAQARIRPRKVMADGFSDAPGDTVLMVQSLQVKPAAAPADAQLGVHASDYAGNDTVALLPAAMGGTVNMGGSPAMSSGGCNVSGTASPSGAWLLLALIMFAARRRFN